MLSQIIGSVVIILVAITIYPIIQDQIELAKAEIDEEDLTPTVSMMLDWVPIIFIAVSVLMGLGILFQSLRSAGLIGEGEEEFEPEAKPKKSSKPHKQTYLEYVKERLEVERLMDQYTP